MKKVLVIGATGLVGKNIVTKLTGKVEVIAASLNHDSNPVDLSNPESLKALFAKVGKVDAIICTAGVAHFKALAETGDQDWQFAINNKMMGQINTIRFGQEYLNENGVIILTTGILAQYPMPGSAIVSAVNAAVEATVKGYSLELENTRINAVSPGWVKETMEAMGMDSTPGMPASEVAQYYLDLLDTSTSGEISTAVKTVV